jgi:hypothetical protein
MGAKVSNVQGYVLMIPPAPVRLREVRGYVMGAPPLSINLRSVAGYAMATYIPLPKGQTFATALMTMILARAKSVRPATHFNLGAVEVGDVVGYNSKVKLTPTALAQLSGEMYFHYNRVYMNRMPDLSSVVVGSETTTHALISKINTLTGMQLTVADIVDEPIDSEATVVSIKAAATSYLFVPGTSVSVGSILPPLSSAFTDPIIRWS